MQSMFSISTISRGRESIRFGGRLVQSEQYFQRGARKEQHRITISSFFYKLLESEVDLRLFLTDGFFSDSDPINELLKH